MKEWGKKDFGHNAGTGCLMLVGEEGEEEEQARGQIGLMLNCNG